MNTKYLWMTSLPLALSGALLAGCNGSGTTETTGTQTQPVAQSDAPAGSTAAEAEAKTGEESGAMNGMKARTDSTKLAFSSEPSALPVGKSATWTLKVTDSKSGQPVKDFTVVHDKLMHLIVVNKDLSWFNHIHPTLGSDGAFTVQTALPTAGNYKLYADYTPKNGGNEVAQHEFATAGNVASVSQVSLTPDAMKGPWMTKKVVAHPEGEPNAKGGATYEVALMPMPMPLLAGQDTMLHFQVRDANGQPIKDLQPYLGALGHCVILSQDTSKYLHSHPMEGGAEHDMSKMGDMDMSKMNEAPAPKSGGPDVMFHTNFPVAGLYKTWGQFMHKGKIITAPFVVNVGAPKAGAATANATQDESQPHSH